MPKFIFRLFIILVPISFILFFYMILTEEDSYPGADYSNFKVPEFEIQNLAQDDLINKASLEGSYILNVWASWCITCRVEHGFLSRLSNEGIPIIGLNYKDKKDDAISWITKFGDPYELIIHDLKGELALDMGVTGAPETFLLHNGNVIAQYRGEVNKMIWNDVFMPIIEKEEIFNNHKSFYYSHKLDSKMKD